jgi:hypothetical protein
MKTHQRCTEKGQEIRLRNILLYGIFCWLFLAPLGAFLVSAFCYSSDFFDKEYLAAFGRAQASLALLLLARYFLSFLYFRENGR